MTDKHIPVMRDRMVDLLGPAVTASSSPIVVDGTLGLGGHSEAILQRYPHVRLIGFDRDPIALEMASERLAPFGARFLGIHTEYHLLREAFESVSHPLTEQALEHGINGALYDLGVSSMQLDEDDRGFSYSRPVPLDMRMDPTHGITAADVVNTYDFSQLVRILQDYGDERFATKIARAIEQERTERPFTTSDQLVELLYRVIPAATRRTGGHPAKRTFQALRVEVNQELAGLKAAVPAVVESLAPGGRAIFMSYQSQEDRLVKRIFASFCEDRTPLDLPVHLPGSQPEYRLIGRGSEKADAAELQSNPRSASVRVRVIERREREDA